MSEKNIKQKVDSFAGEVTKSMHYHHGEASLTQTIIRMGQCFYGSNNLPLMKGMCIGFGSRKSLGRSLGQPRYIHIKLNKILTDNEIRNNLILNGQNFIDKYFSYQEKSSNELSKFLLNN